MGLVQYIEGKAFEDEVRRSWSVIPDSWLLRITDGKKTGPRPADFIAITNKCNRKYVLQKSYVRYSSLHRKVSRLCYFRLSCQSQAGSLFGGFQPYND